MALEKIVIDIVNRWRYPSQTHPPTRLPVNREINTENGEVVLEEKARDDSNELPEEKSAFIY